MTIVHCPAGVPCLGLRKLVTVWQLGTGLCLRVLIGWNGVAADLAVRGAPGSTTPPRLTKRAYDRPWMEPARQVPAAMRCAQTSLITAQQGIPLLCGCLGMLAKAKPKHAPGWSRRGRCRRECGGRRSRRPRRSAASPPAPPSTSAGTPARPMDSQKLGHSAS